MRRVLRAGTGKYPTRITREAETMWEREHESVTAES